MWRRIESILPMFPLGTAFLPGEIVPLRVFEDRYVLMMRELLASDAPRLRFGSVLIERGGEVGGDDIRRTHGVLIRVENIDVNRDGGYSVVGVAEDVIRVEVWNTDAPYPRAEVSILEATAEAIDDVLIGRVSRCAEQVVALLSAHERLDALVHQNLTELVEVADGLGSDAVVEPDLADAVRKAIWAVARCVPIGPEDRYDLLTAESLISRLERLEAATEHAREVLDFLRGSRD